MYSTLDPGDDAPIYEKDPPNKLPFYKKAFIFVASAIVMVAILLIIFLVLLKSTKSNDTLRPFTLDSVFNSSLSPKSFSLQWGGNGQFFIYQNTSISRDWLKFDLNTTDSSLYVNATDLQTIVPNYSTYTISADGQYILFAVNVTSVWRHSFLAVYLVYSVADGTVIPLVDGNPQLQNVVWNPVNHQVAYVRDLDIWIFDPATKTSTQVTNDGDAAGGILNGIQSWVYEEEVFSDFNAMWWSPDGTQLAYLRFNESQVPIFEYTEYTTNAYPTQVPLRYPYAGYTNPQVELYVYSVPNAGASLIESFGDQSAWEYIASVQWSISNQLWIQQLNRYQNVSSAAIATPGQGLAVVNVQTSTWIDISPFTFCTIGATEYILQQLPNNDHYHIASFQLTTDWTKTFLTSGDFDVISISGCSPAGLIYYLSTESATAWGVQGATVQHIYTLNPTQDNAIFRVNQNSGVFSTSFSPLGDYYVMRYSGPGVPQHFLVAADGRFNITLQSNEAYAQAIAEYELPEKIFTTVKGAAGDTLNAYYKIPKNVKYDSPLILDVYAGPGTQDVRQVYDVGGLDAWLCANGYIVAAVDGRGTGNRGLSFMQATYRQLGLLEMADQRVAAKNLAEAIKQVDSDRVGIWGWSFGGFMALQGISNTSGIEGFQFKAAVSVAPVTSWTLYDTIYTERFMSTPQDNPEGYAATSVIQKAANIPSNTLLLMHGLADDNVHFQNSAEMVLAIIRADVQFDTMYYPNDNHAINNGNSRRYLYQKMMNFLNGHL